MYKIFFFIKKFLFSTLIMVIDLGTKIWILKNFFLYESISIFSFLNFSYIRNYGIVFGFWGENTNFQKFFLSLLRLFSIIILIYLVSKKLENNKYYYFSYSLILGGALGNFFDHLYHGFVIDFIDLHFKSWHFFIFNIADLSIFIGLILIFFKNYIRVFIY